MILRERVRLLNKIFEDFSNVAKNGKNLILLTNFGFLMSIGVDRHLSSYVFL